MRRPRLYLAALGGSLWFSDQNWLKSQTLPGGKGQLPSNRAKVIIKLSRGWWEFMCWWQLGEGPEQRACQGKEEAKMFRGQSGSRGVPEHLFSQAHAFRRVAARIQGWAQVNGNGPEGFDSSSATRSSGRGSLIWVKGIAELMLFILVFFWRKDRSEGLVKDRLLGSSLLGLCRLPTEA